jgi:hypothetical protein
VTGRQRQVFGLLVVSLLVGLAIVALSSADEDGERIASGAGVFARAGLTTVVEAAPTVADPPTTTSTALAPAPASPTTTLRRPVSTTAPATTTTTRQAVVTTSTTAPAPLAAASAAPASTPAAPAPTTTVPPTTTTTVDPCRNSTDSQCGPFRFDPQPGADRPMTVEVNIEPAAPVAGRPMVFHITLTDPDGVSYDGTTFNFGNSGIGGSTPEPCAKFGPWDPPAPDPASATKTTDVTHTYFEAGSYTATFVFDAGPFDCVDSVTGRGDRPYASSATGTVIVVVA